MSEEVEQAMIELRKFMFDHVYKNPVAKGEETKAKAMIEQLFFYYMEHIELLPENICACVTPVRQSSASSAITSQA